MRERERERMTLTYTYSRPDACVDLRMRILTFDAVIQIEETDHAFIMRMRVYQMRKILTFFFIVALLLLPQAMKCL